MESMNRLIAIESPVPDIISDVFLETLVAPSPIGFILLEQTPAADRLARKLERIGYKVQRTSGRG